MAKSKKLHNQPELRLQKLGGRTDKKDPCHASEAIRDRIAYKRSARIQVRPKVLRDSLPEGMELQTATFRYKRGFWHECICHDHWKVEVTRGTTPPMPV
jgi:hypothetical protein